MGPKVDEADLLAAGMHDARDAFDGQPCTGSRNMGPLLPAGRATFERSGSAHKFLPTLEELGIGFVSFSPLGKGFLTRAIDETRGRAKA